jgi:polyisoprenoid-binding protein YceI
MKITPFVVALWLSTSAWAAGTGWVAPLQEGVVEFHAVGRPSLLKIHGKSTSVTGQFKIDGMNATTGNATFQLDTLDTGISMRDKHMKEKYLEVGKFPEAKLEVTSLTLPKEFLGDHYSGDALPFKGKLTLHGVEKQVEGTTSVVRDGTSIQAKTDFKVNITDFGIEKPSFAGITVKEDVDVHVELKSSLKAQ